MLITGKCDMANLFSLSSPPDQQCLWGCPAERLIFTRKLLADDHTLSDYSTSIRKELTLCLVIVLLGSQYRRKECIFFNFVID